MPYGGKQSFLLPQALGNRVVAWGSNMESDYFPEDLPWVFSVIVASEEMGYFAHPHLL